MQEEIWLPVKDFEDLYEVSDLGRVRRDWHGKYKYLKPGITDGYAQVMLSRNGIQRGRKVHHLVQEAFQGIDFEALPKGYETHHKDEIRDNNRSDNLEILSHSENQKRSYAKRTDQWRIQTAKRLGIKNEPSTPKEPDVPKEPTIQDLQRAVWDEIKYYVRGKKTEKGMKELLQIS